MTRRTKNEEGGWKRLILVPQEKTDFGWRRKNKSIILFARSAHGWIFQCQRHCHLSKHRCMLCPYGGIGDSSGEVNLKMQTDSAMPKFTVHSYLATFTNLPKGLCSSRCTGINPHV